MLPACVVLADVSGFTPLVERLSRDQVRGAEAVQEVINRVFRPLVDLVDAAGGEVLRFPGDAALALWTAPEAELGEAVRRAARCGLAVQSSLDRLGVLPGVELRLRIAVGAGSIQAASVGGVEGRWEFLVRGGPIDQLGSTLAETRPGEVLLSSEAARLAGSSVSGPRRGAFLRADSAEAPPVPPPQRDACLPSEAALRAYVPRIVQARLHAGQREWLAEFRRVTVAFVGLSGLPPGDPAPFLERLQEAIRVVQTHAYRYGGSVNQAVEDEKGTTVVLVWGLALHTHEDDATRAVRAAFDLQEDLARLGFGCRIGIATDRAFTGRRGSPLRAEYGLMGSCMNLAARLMQAASPILCDGATRAGARRQILFAPLPPIRPKGVSARVRVYQPRARRPERATILGRGPERALLEQRVLALGASNQGGFILLVGDPGIGKTRLVAHLLDGVRATAARALLGSSDPIERSTQFHAWKPVFETLLGPDPLRDAAGRLAEWVGPEQAARAALLNPLLPTPLPETAITRAMAPQGRAQATQDLLVGILRRFSERAPLAVILEDAQWMDSASWKLAEAVAQELPSVLLVVTMRPMGKELPPEAARIRDHPRTWLIKLDVLDPESTRALVCRRLDVDSIPDEVASFILARADGHPFFTEELACSLRDRGAIVVEDGECRLAEGAPALSRLDLPDTVQGVVASRLDLLSASQQLTLKVASVVGLRFNADDVLAAHPIEEDPATVASELEAMTELGLLCQDEAGHYRFKHGIIQETAYRMLAYAQRSQLHGRVAARLEAVWGPDVFSIAPLLAHHWKEAGAVGKASEYLSFAAEKALLRDYANREAAHFLEELLELPEEEPLERSAAGVTLPDRFTVSGRAEQLARWERQLAEALFNLGEHPAGLTHVERSLALLGEKVGRSRSALALRVLARLAVHLVWPSLPRRRARVEGEGRIAAEAIRAYERLAITTYTRGDLLWGIDCLLRALELGRRSGATTELAKAYADFSNLAALCRWTSLARRYSELALRTARETGDPGALAIARSRGSLHRMVQGDWSALAAFDEAIAISEQLGNHYQWEETSSARATVDLYRGEFEASRRRYGEVLESALRSGSLVHQLWALAGQADASLRLGRHDEAIDLAEAALALHRQSESLDVTTPFQASGILASAWLRKEGLERSAPWAARARAAMTLPARLGYAALSGFVGIAEYHLSQGERQALPGPDGRALRAVCRAFASTARSRPVFVAAAWRFEGLRAWRLGRRRRARRAWSTSLAAAQRLELGYEAACAHLEIGRHLPDGDPERRLHLAQAASGFAKAGAAWDLERVAELGGA
jgi:class 3 adenylate cyclase/tetratricopeptide (TPR) repeat protein